MGVCENYTTLAERAQDRLLGYDSDLQGRNTASEPDAMFADDAKYVQKMGEAEEFPYAFANFEELQLAASRFGRRVEADEGAEAHAVHEGEIGQVQHDSFGDRNHRAHVVVENIGQTGDQLPVASHDGQVVFTLNLKGEVFGS